MRLLFLACLLFISGTALLADEERVLVEFDKPFPLASVGGPNMDLIFKKDQMTTFTVQLVDHDNLVPRLSQPTHRDSPRYRPGVELVPTIQTVTLSKKVSEPDQGLSKLYPILRTEDGDFQVLFSDRLSVPQGKRQLVIRTRND